MYNKMFETLYLKIFIHGYVDLLVITFWVDSFFHTFIDMYVFKSKFWLQKFEDWIM